jgi:hypothetical protein
MALFSDENEARDAAFIAAASTPPMLALLDELESKDRRNAELGDSKPLTNCMISAFRHGLQHDFSYGRQMIKAGFESHQAYGQQ